MVDGWLVRFCRLTWLVALVVVVGVVFVGFGKRDAGAEKGVHGRTARRKRPVCSTILRTYAA